MKIIKRLFNKIDDKVINGVKSEAPELWWEALTPLGVLFSTLLLGALAFCLALSFAFDFFNQQPDNTIQINSDANCEFVDVKTVKTWNKAVPKEGNQWLKIHVKIINKGADRMFVSSDNMFTLVDDDRKEINPRNEILGESQLENASVMDEGFVEGDVIFEVPSDKKTFTLNLYDATDTYDSRGLGVKDARHGGQHLELPQELCVNTKTKRVYDEKSKKERVSGVPSTLVMCALCTVVPLIMTALTYFVALVKERNKDEDEDLKNKGEIQ